MKLFLDTCVWGGAKRSLATESHDVVWTGDWPEDPGDEEILARALKEQRILVTLDKDFGELAIIRRKPHCGIIRLVNIPARQQAPMCSTLLKRYGSELEKGAIVTATENRVRIRSMSGNRAD